MKSKTKSANSIFLTIMVLLILSIATLVSSYIYFEYEKEVAQMKLSQDSSCLILKQADDIIWTEVNEKPYFLVDMLNHEE